MHKSKYWKCVITFCYLFSDYSSRIWIDNIDDDEYEDDDVD